MTRTLRVSLLALAGAISLSAFACSSSDSTTTTTSGPTSTSSGMGGAGGGAGGAGGGTDNGPPNWNRMVTPPKDSDAAAQRLACGYKAGSLPAETQGESHPSGKAIPIKHILVLMQENRSFDSYFQMLPKNGQPDVEVAPPGYTNPDAMNTPIAPMHDSRYCLVDTNHEWDGSHKEYNDGKMDGFVLANDNSGTAPPHPLADSMSGVRALSYYDATDIPFYYWMANEFSIADHYHCSLLGPTWPNRMYLYAASSRGAAANKLTEFDAQAGACKADKECMGGAAGSCVNGSCKGTCKVDVDCGVDSPKGTCDVAGGGACRPVGRTIFDYMQQRHLNWKVYAGGTPGFAVTTNAWAKYMGLHQVDITEYFADAKSGNLPDVAFIDPHLGSEAYNQDDEHPPASPQPGQLFVATVVEALTKSPAWADSALFVTYDENGGFYDHVPPPSACQPDGIKPDLEPTDPPGDFDRLGMRVPMMVVSPYAKKHFVAHHVYDHTSILRFIEDRFVLPAITNRDANAEEPWEMFDFQNPPHKTPPTVTLPTVNQASLDACAKVWK